MQDFVPLGTGNSRSLKSSVSAGTTWEQALEMLRNGTFPIDIGNVNDSGVAQKGTPLNKANLLDDLTASRYDLGSTATVDDVLSEIANRLALISGNMASITATVQDTAGNPLQGVVVYGIFDEDGYAVQTNTSGVASGYISEGQTTVSITGYADIQNFSTVLTIVKGSSYTETFTVTTQNFLKVLSTQLLKFSGNVEQVDVSVGGGGGAAAAAKDYGPDFPQEPTSFYASGGGGAGGYCTVSYDVAFSPNVEYQAVVGAGGQSAGADGGQSSFLGIAANGGSGGSQGSRETGGGQGGAGNGNGGNGTYTINSDSSAKPGSPGAQGTVSAFSSFTATIVYGGGGGSGAAATASSPASGGAGANFGGDGGGITSRYNGAGDGQNGQDGYGGGGGSGAVQYESTGDDYGNQGNHGKGGSGCIAIRMHLKSAA